MSSEYFGGLTEKQANRNGFRLIMALAIFQIIVVLSSLVVIDAELGPQRIVAALRPIAFVGLAFLARAGYARTAVTITVFSIYLVFVVQVGLTSGLGIFAALLSFFICFGLVTQVFSSDRLLPIGGIIMGLSIALIIMELYWPYSRHPIPSRFADVLSIVSIFAGLTFIVIIFRTYDQYTLQVKFTLAVTILALLGVIITTYVVSINVRDILEERVGQQLRNSASLEAGVVGELLAQQIRALQTFNSNRGVGQALEASNTQYDELTREQVVETVLEQEAIWEAMGDEERAELVLPIAKVDMVAFERTFPDMDDVIVTDRQGGLVAYTGSSPKSFFYGDERWWQVGFGFNRGVVYVGDPQLDAGGNYYTVDIATPIYNDAFDEVAGVVQTTYQLDKFSSTVSSVLPSGTNQDISLLINGQIYEYDQRGTPKFEQIDEAFQEQIDAFVAGEVNFAQAVRGEEQVLWGGAKVESFTNEPVVSNLDWMVLVHQLETAAFEGSRNQQKTQIMIGVGIVVAGALAAVFVGRLVSQPVQMLADAALQVANGNRDTRVDLSSNDEIGKLATSFNTMVSQLQGVERNLEARVQERTRALETSARVSRSLSQIIEKDALVKQIVEQVREAFDYYYVQVYVPASNGRQLDLVGGSGEAGRKMLEKRHSLLAGRGVVGQAYTTNTAVSVPDVSIDSSWQANELLPDTKSEVAIPISIGDEILGVLDVQNDEVNSISQQDVNVLQSLASQIGVALRNAALYEEAQNEAELEQLINQIGQRIQQTTDVDSALKTAVRELGQALPGVGTSVRLVNGQ